MAQADTGQVDTASSVGTLVYLQVGPIAWALHLALVYGLQPMICARSATASTVLVLLATAICLAAVAAALIWSRGLAGVLRARAATQASRRFHRRVMRWAGLLAAVGIIWTGAAATIVPACDPLR